MQVITDVCSEIEDLFQTRQKHEGGHIQKSIYEGGIDTTVDLDMVSHLLRPEVGTNVSTYVLYKSR